LSKNYQAGDYVLHYSLSESDLGQKNLIQIASFQVLHCQRSAP